MAEERALDIGGAGGAEQRLGGVVGEHLPVAHEQQPIAAGGLVHDVARDEQGGSGIREPVEQLPELHAQHGVEADRRLVEHEQLRSSEQGGGERDPGALAARERADDAAGVRREVGLLDDAGDIRSRRAEHGAEVGDVLRHREVVVDARGLRHVADPVPERRAAGRLAEHRDGSRLHHLHADDGAHEGGLAAPARPEQADDAATCDGQVEAVQNAGSPSLHTQIPDVDGRGRAIHHVMNYSPAVTAPSRGKPVRCHCTAGPRRATSSSIGALASGSRRST